MYCDVKVSQRWHIEDYYQKLLNKMPKPLPNFDDVSVILAKVILCNSCICLFPHFNWSDIYLPSNKGMLQLYRVNLRCCCLPCIHRSKCSGHVYLNKFGYMVINCVLRTTWSLKKSKFSGEPVEEDGPLERSN